MFAPFDPAPETRPAPVDAVIEAATPAALEALVALAVARDGSDPAARRRRFTALLEDAGAVVRVARVGGEVVGYGLATRLEPPEGPYVPAGWYLAGAVVDPSWRRRGIGAALVDARVEALRPRTRTVRAFVAAVNRASVALLRSRGFVVESEDAGVPGVTFTGGRGVLLRRDAPG